MTNDNAKTTAQLFDKFHEVATFDRYATADEELTTRFKQYVYNMPEDIADIEYGQLDRCIQALHDALLYS